ncbi:uncharacterized protein [Argopecten irradians]|uniref:uncharacterized protein isoform X2 n=1 Tax=Argopecten irradians TaxID=31199 RepID=UPI00371BE63F
MDCSYLSQVLILYLLGLCLFLPGSRSLHRPDGLIYLHTEKIHVYFNKITYVSNPVRKRSTPDRLPESLDLHFHAKEHNIILSLYRNSKLSTDVPIHLPNQGLWPSSQSLDAFYQDVGNRASFHVECTNGGSCNELELFGTFYIEDELHILETDTDIHGFNSSTFSHPHIVSQPAVPLQFANANDAISLQHSSKQFSQRRGRRRRQTGTYMVELFVVTDYSVYKYWYDASTQTTNNRRRNDALNKIRTFVAFHINGIDARYASLNASYTIDVTFAGLYISETPDTSTWTESVKSANNIVNVGQVIENFRVWVEAEKAANNIPKHDHAMLFTRYDLELNGNTGNIGYAYQAEICSPASQSVVEDQFNFIVETTAAHELGHSLGAKHDGVDNICLPSNAHIMAASSVAKTGSQARNPWVFSLCSANEIGTYINSINNNCLLTTNSQTDPNEIDSYMGTEIGQMYDVNMQCEKAVGQGSYLCLQFYSDFETVCTGMWCKDPASTQCTLILPADGTTCNSSKWCRQGNCVTSVDAPNVPSTCLYGDIKGIVYGSYTCQSMGTQQPWGCYQQNSSCCTTCQSLYTGINGCEYGDKTNCSGVTNSQCYAGDNANLCCETCQSFSTNIPGCEYGDRADCSAIQSSQCYISDNAHVCCQTCKNLQIAIPGCPYGDRALGCLSTSCASYSQTNLDICCLTCYTGPPITSPGPQTTIPITMAVTTTVQTTSTVTTTPATQTTVSATSTVSSGSTTIPPASTNLPAWVIPVAVIAAVVVIILVLVGVVCYCLRTRKPKAAKPPARGPSTISRGFTGTANVAYQMDSVAVTDRYAYIPPQNVRGPRVSALSKQKPPPARPPPRRPPPPGRQLSTTSQPHEYVEITAPTHSEYMELQARQSTKSRAYQSLKIPNT